MSNIILGHSNKSIRCQIDDTNETLRSRLQLEENQLEASLDTSHITQEQPVRLAGWAEVITRCSKRSISRPEKRSSNGVHLIISIGKKRTST
jgi:hypothetical protein